MTTIATDGPAVNREQPARGDRSAELTSPGLYHGVPMRRYLALPAISAHQLEWLSVSPKYYRHMMDAEDREDTAAQQLGSALHAAVLEPELFARTYVLEPDPEEIAPGMQRPRATKAFREALCALEDQGKIVLRRDTMAAVRGMAAAVAAHPVAAQVLEQAPEREVTMVWRTGARLCRARADSLGPGLIVHLKTTRSLRDFSPWVISRLGYYRTAAWYERAQLALAGAVCQSVFVAIENEAPHDVGVFQMDEAAMVAGEAECERLVQLLDVCERGDRWPGMFPELQQGTVTDAIADAVMEVA